MGLFELLGIVVISVLGGAVALWLIRYWVDDVPKIVPKIVWFVVIVIIAVALAQALGLLGMHDPKVPHLF